MNLQFRSTQGADWLAMGAEKDCTDLQDDPFGDKMRECAERLRHSHSAESLAPLPAAAPLSGSACTGMSLDQCLGAASLQRSGTFAMRSSSEEALSWNIEWISEDSQQPPQQPKQIHCLIFQDCQGSLASAQQILQRRRRLSGWPHHLGPARCLIRHLPAWAARPPSHLPRPG